MFFDVCGWTLTRSKLMTDTTKTPAEIAAKLPDGLRAALLNQIEGTGIVRCSARGGSRMRALERRGLVYNANGCGVLTDLGRAVAAENEMKRERHGTHEHRNHRDDHRAPNISRRQTRLDRSRRNASRSGLLRRRVLSKRHRARFGAPRAQGGHRARCHVSHVVGDCVRAEQLCRLTDLGRAVAAELAR